MILVNLEQHSDNERMIKRQIQTELVRRLGEVPAVGLLGPRQVGKTTLALRIADSRPSVYLDLESDRDRAKLQDAEAYLELHEDKLVILDEVHRVPDLFNILRGLVDRGRRTGRKAGRFLLLGSASIDLLRQSAETLAGRISYLELGPITAAEVASADIGRLWLRGGFPDSFRARNNEASQRWRTDFIRTYLERDIPMLGPRIAAETLRRFWTMLAHHQSGLLNASEFARSLGVDSKTVASYLDLMVDLLLVRRLSPWHHNSGKRLVKSPRVYIRDSGLTHSLLGLTHMEDVLSHPVAGGSWEAFSIETLISAAPMGTEANFYRTAAGAEIDLLLSIPRHGLWAIEVKRSSAPALGKGFHQACADLKPARRLVVYPGRERYPLGHKVEVMAVNQAAQDLRRLRVSPPK